MGAVQQLERVVNRFPSPALKRCRIGPCAALSAAATAAAAAGGAGAGNADAAGWDAAPAGWAATAAARGAGLHQPTGDAAPAGGVAAAGAGAGEPPLYSWQWRQQRHWRQWAGNSCCWAWLSRWTCRRCCCACCFHAGSRRQPCGGWTLTIGGSSHFTLPCSRSAGLGTLGDYASWRWRRRRQHLDCWTPRQERQHWTGQPEGRHWT